MVDRCVYEQLTSVYAPFFAAVRCLFTKSAFVSDVYLKFSTMSQIDAPPASQRLESLSLARREMLLLGFSEMSRKSRVDLIFPSRRDRCDLEPNTASRQEVQPSFVCWITARLPPRLFGSGTRTCKALIPSPRLKKGFKRAANIRSFTNTVGTAAA